MGITEGTVDVNRIMMAAGYQQMNDKNFLYGTSNATYKMRAVVLYRMVNAFNTKFGTNGRIYVIHYRYDPTLEHGWLGNPRGLRTVYKNYTAANQTELKEALNAVLVDIKQWAGYQDAKIVD